MIIIFIFKKKYNYWLKQEIELCKKYNLDIEKYITPSTHPLHAKQIKIALFDELSEEYILKIANKKYTNEQDIIDLRNKLMNQVDVNYFLKRYKPDTIKDNNKINPNDALIGTILGDIIGSKYEFIDHEKVNDLYNKKSHFTDDTVLSLATKLAILENDKNPDYAKWYKKLYKKYPRAGYGSNFVGWALSDNMTGYNSMADGSAMRVSFIGAYYSDIKDVIKNAYDSAIVTHNHIDGIKGAVVTAVIIWMCKNKYTKEEIKEYLYKHYYYTKEQLDNKSLGSTYYNLNDNNNYLSNNGIFCNFAVPYAFKCLIENNSYEECMFKILDNFCDSDTVCAIAGGAAILLFNNDISFYKEKVLEKLTKELNDYLEKC